MKPLGPDCKRLLPKNNLDTPVQAVKIPARIYNMKQSPLPKILLGVLALIAVLSAYYSYSALKNGSELREFQTKLTLINQRLPVINALAMDLIEYSKKNPGLDPLLEAYGIKQGKAPAPGMAPAPATVPAIKTPTK
jgi:hypothetical protein